MIGHNERHVFKEDSINRHLNEHHDELQNVSPLDCLLCVSWTEGSVHDAYL